MTKIAIVEDNRVIRESLAEIVQTDPGCRCVYSCATAEEAIEEIPKFRPDIVLMDIQLPCMTGIECTAHLKQLIPSLHIIMVTVYEDTERIFKALRAGACGYILKRCKPEELASAIREIRSGGAPMTPEIARKVIASFQEPATVSSYVESVTPREYEILELVAGGYPNKEIASRLGLTDATVRWHLCHIYDKLHVRSRTEAALRFLSSKE